MVLVTLITAITHNMAMAVLLGVIISALAYSWENAKRIRARNMGMTTGKSTMKFMDLSFLDLPLCLPKNLMSK